VLFLASFRQTTTTLLPNLHQHTQSVAFVDVSEKLCLSIKRYQIDCISKKHNLPNEVKLPCFYCSH